MTCLGEVMSTSANKMIDQFTHMIEKGWRLSEEEVAKNTQDLMQMLATNPTLRCSWQLLKENLQAIYNSLDDTPVDQHEAVEAKIVQKLRLLA